MVIYAQHSIFFVFTKGDRLKKYGGSCLVCFLYSYEQSVCSRMLFENECFEAQRELFSVYCFPLAEIR